MNADSTWREAGQSLRPNTLFPQKGLQRDLCPQPNGILPQYRSFNGICSVLDFAARQYRDYVANAISCLIEQYWILPRTNSVQGNRGHTDAIDFSRSHWLQAVANLAPQ